MEDNKKYIIQFVIYFGWFDLLHQAVSDSVS
jgi:hypothetical protein